MEFRVGGVIRFHPTHKLQLGETLNFCSPSGAKVDLASTKDDELSVQIVLEAENADDARGMAAMELERISNLLGYLHEVPIETSRIVGVTQEEWDAEGKLIKTGEIMVGTDAIVSLVKKLDLESAESLGHLLEKVYVQVFHDIIAMWRQAISIEEPALKYMLLYRLMESLFEGSEELTNWVIKEEPEVEIRDERPRGRHTIYTWLRDNVHAKTRLFPYAQMKNALPRFQNLVRKRIKEKFKVDYPQQD